MTRSSHDHPDQRRLHAALWLVLRRYYAQVRRWKGPSVAEMLKRDYRTCTFLHKVFTKRVPLSLPVR